MTGRAYKTVIGVDPDVDKHGVARYQSGKLKELTMLDSYELAQYAKKKNALVAVENVQSNGFLYARNNHSSKTAQSKIAMNVGRNQQAQVELVRLLKHFGVDVIQFKPQAGNWANRAGQFKMITGWEGRSNADTRSAAYFGWLAMKSKRNTGARDAR